ncbi:hypothetical protein LTR36_001203 [Oleoguttula mirabilis]|uniref:uS12 prolyl 3,4-dihydroxylase n=1 Tax=Oleoguttula mirabilis TaxID=1507867 RepID=A0AAV9J328_9PEZI|nr:hypothetical protein LTR36_001203 [Oleoguttula mirabilis]
MKRKADQTDATAANGHHHRKKAATVANGLRDRFGPAIFDVATVKQYASDYASSEPYKHAVVSSLIDDTLLRSVRREILDNIHFTPKETDIYKIHQSGDLANLDGLDPAALKKLPSLLKLRDALYGKEFRRWISDVSGAGPVSGKKTDMAVNVYVPGCHLLCHDDVIGSRRVSYILYLTDPDTPWKAGWGGALRLYPTDNMRVEDGKVYKVPQAEWTKVIPPAWNQLSFFAVQPGESFHDVEEVYQRGAGESEEDGGRFRMAISGWFHIPQEGEEGFEPGLEERLAEKSSLQQLQGKADQFDEPQTIWVDPTTHATTTMSNGETDATGEEELTEKDLEFLLQYMTPNYLTPDTVEELNELFAEESTLQLTDFLNQKFAKRLRKHFESRAGGAPTSRDFRTARPPHKHRYQYLHPTSPARVGETTNPYEALLDELLPSAAFGKWLALATGLELERCSVLARRFRRAVDYQLAQGYEGEEPQLEWTLSVTPSLGWGGEGEEGGGGDDAEADGGAEGNGEEKSARAETGAADEEANVGGYELYMAGDEGDSDDDNDDDGSDDGVTIPASITQSSTGAGDRRSAKRQLKKKASDPAVYQAAADDDDDDGILFSNPAGWNTMSIVLRDKGTLKFVKYVSRAARGDRWDFTGAGEVGDGDEGVEEGV